MKIKTFKATGLAATAIITASLFAGTAKADWLSDIVVKETPAVSDLSNGAFFSGGKTRVRIPTSTIRPVIARAPEVSAGCGGIDAFWGGISFLDPEHFVQMGENIIASAPSYAFDLALGGLCSECKDVMDTLKMAATDLNSLSLDSCAASRGLVESGAKFMGEVTGFEAKSGKASGTASSFYKKEKEQLKEFTGKASNWFTQNNDTKVDKLANDLLFPASNNAAVSFWETMRQRKITATTGTGIDNSLKAAQGFFSTPKDYVGFLRLITGDFIIYRQGDPAGGSASLLASIFTNNTDPNYSKLPVHKTLEARIKNTDLATTSDKGVLSASIDWELQIGSTATTDECAVQVKMNPLDAIVTCNKIPVALLTVDVPTDYLATGIVYGTGADDMNINVKEPEMVTLAALGGGVSKPKDYFKTMITGVLANIHQVGAANTAQSTDLNSYMTWQQIPIYQFTNTVGVLKKKYPGITSAISDRLGETAAYSYSTGRLIASIDEAIKLLGEAEGPIKGIAKQHGFPNGEALSEWIIEARGKLSNEKSRLLTMMNAKTATNTTFVTDKIKEYIALNNQINEVLAGSMLTKALNFK